jgi:hypothetical protein
MDHDIWTYEIKRNIIEYLRGTDEFLKCTSEDIRKKGCMDTCLSLSRLSKLTEILKYQRSERSFDSSWIYRAIHPIYLFT